MLICGRTDEVKKHAGISELGEVQPTTWQLATE